SFSKLRDSFSGSPMLQSLGLVKLGATYSGCMTDILDTGRVSQEEPPVPPFGRYGPCLKAFHPRKSLSGLLRKMPEAGSIPAVKHGLKNAGESAKTSAGAR